MTDLHPIDDDLDRHNLRILSARLDWPREAAGECERVGRLHPDWSAYWSRWPQPGYYAVYEEARSGERPVFGVTPDELVAAIETVPPRQGLGGFTPLEPLKTG